MDLYTLTYRLALVLRGERANIRAQTAVREGYQEACYALSGKASKLHQERLELEAAIEACHFGPACCVEAMPDKG